MQIVRLNSNEEKYIHVYECGIDKIIPPYIYTACGDKKWIRKRNGEERISYIYAPLFLDTETSHNHIKESPITWIYQWALEFDELCVSGRTPTQLIDVLKKFKKTYQLDNMHRILIYIHNASYDLTYLMPYIEEAFGQGKILAIKPHKIISFTVDGFEFRCSYMLSNRSLKAWGEYTNAEVVKAVDTISYDEIRYQDSELNCDDWFYMINDIYAMKYAYNKMLDMFNDDITTIPLTNTGYIRRDMRNESKIDPQNRENFLKSQLTYDLYRLFRSEFSGGLTHGNRLYINKTIKAKIEHYDYKSHYPSCQQLKYYPVTAFELYYKWRDGREPLSMSELLTLCKKYCVIMEITFQNFYIKDNVYLPCISQSKTEKGKRSPLIYTIDREGKHRGTDNGKVMYMQGFTTLALTELDFKWILKQYTFDSIKVECCYIAERGSMPKYFTDVLHRYFYIKENAEGIQREKAKNNLNAGYGMSAQDPVRMEIEYNRDNGEWTSLKEYNEEYITEKLSKFYKSRNNFFSYQVGCYVTSHARDCLLSMVEMCGKKYLYADTDSIFFIHDDNIIDKIKKYNDDIISDCEARGLFVKNKKGGKSYYGTFEDEHDNIICMRYLHAKCYAYIDDKEDLHVTIAGVTKKGRNGNTIEKELGNIDNLNNAFTFQDCGGTTSEYIIESPKVEYINGHLTEHAGGCIIRNCDKHLSSIEYLEPFTRWEWQESDDINS